MFLLFTTIMSNRQKYHCYMYSEQATENFLQSQNHLCPVRTLSTEAVFSPKTASVKCLLMRILFERIFSVIWLRFM